MHIFIYSNGDGTIGIDAMLSFLNFNKQGHNHVYNNNNNNNINLEKLVKEKLFFGNTAEEYNPIFYTEWNKIVAIRVVLFIVNIGLVLYCFKIHRVVVDLLSHVVGNNNSNKNNKNNSNNYNINNTQAYHIQ